jgi:hypothetical protein
MKTRSIVVALSLGFALTPAVVRAGDPPAPAQAPSPAPAPAPKPVKQATRAELEKEVELLRTENARLHAEVERYEAREEDRRRNVERAKQKILDALANPPR